MFDAQSRSISVRLLHVYVNLPTPFYDRLLSVIIASAVRYLPYGTPCRCGACCRFMPNAMTLRVRCRQLVHRLRVALPLSRLR